MNSKYIFELLLRGLAVIQMEVEAKKKETKSYGSNRIYKEKSLKNKLREKISMRTVLAMLSI